MTLRAYHFLLVITFCALLCVPGLTMIVKPETPQMYGVKTVKYPPFEASFPWLTRFEAYFTANQGHKQHFIELHNELGYRVLHDLQSDNVLVGKDQWLFLKQNFGWESFRSEQPLSAREAAAWQSSVQGARAWLGEQGIPFLFVVVPSKERIYPEHLPASAVRARSITRLDEMLAVFREAKIDTIDLRGPLLEAKRQSSTQIYDSIDSHWNGAGARVGAELILTRTAELLNRPASFAALNSHLVPRQSWGDMPLILSLQDFITAPSVELVGDAPRAHRLEPPESIAVPSRAQMDRLVFEVADDSLPKALIIRDSFAEMFTPTLAEKFRRSVWLWTHDLDLRVVNREQPDIVIVEMTERFFSGKPARLLGPPKARK